jgi:integrase
LDDPTPHFRLPTQKSGKPQYLPLSRRLREEVFTPENVAALKQGEQGRFTKDPAIYVFPFLYATARARMDRLYDACDINAKSLHVLRHSFATRKLREGVPVHSVSKLMGHASTRTTERQYDFSSALDFAHYLDSAPKNEARTAPT